MDDTLRQLERNGSRSEFLAALQRSGQLTEQHLRLLAYCGDIALVDVDTPIDWFNDLGQFGRWVCAYAGYKVAKESNQYTKAIVGWLKRPTEFNRETCSLFWSRALQLPHMNNYAI